MSDQMAVGDNAIGDETKLNSDEATAASAVEVAQDGPEPPSDPPVQETEAPAEEAETAAAAVVEPNAEAPEEEDQKPELNIKQEVDIEENVPEHIDTEIKSEPPESEDQCDGEEKRGIKRRASSAFSDVGDEQFKGFDLVDQNDLTGYNRVLERLEAEVSAASKDFVPVRNVMATPSAPVRASKRARQDTDGSRPSSALSSRSDGDGSTSTEAPSSSPANRGRRATTEMSSPLLRAPLELGWRRELVYRAALDAHSRRNADIYYYTPRGNKLRSTREVAENLAGTGLTLENFSFFKEPLGVDDPEKEIIRDAKLMRRVESPVAAVAVASVEGKRAHKPKPPKGASPDPQPPLPAAAQSTSPPAKIKVKSMGSRLSNNGAATPPAAANKTNKKPPADNNNTAAWKKPRPALVPPPAPPAGLVPPPAHAAVPPPPAHPPAHAAGPPPPPPLTSRPPLLQHQASPEAQPARQLVQPCSMSCGRGAVPSLSCAACLCLYHPACAGYTHAPPQPFFCKNCRRSSPSAEPPPLTHKSGTSGPPPSLPPAPSLPLPALSPAPRPARPPRPVRRLQANPPRPDHRLTLRMKVSGGAPDGSRVWAVAGAPRAPAPLPPAPLAPAAPTHNTQAIHHAATLPQSIAILNGRRFIVVPSSEEMKKRGRIANGAASPPAAVSPRRRGRPRTDDTDHFTAFYNRAQEKNYNVVVQIFQYLGMRDLAHCARVCKLWQQMASTPALWRHVRMKNSHVSDWGGLCSALKRHGTKRLDLRKMLLPQNDTAFWEQFAQHIGTVESLERIEMCRCPARAVEAVCVGVKGLRALSALAIRDALLDPTPLGALPLLHELRLKSMAGLSLTRDLTPLASLQHLQHLSLTSIKELGWCACDVLGELQQLESLELGECTFRAEFAGVLGRLHRLRRLRLERGTAQCAAPDILRALARLPLLTRLELVNIDIKVGFDDALAECKNIQRLLIIPTYVSQSATTNKQVLSGVLRLKETLTHLMWGVTIELLRVTELFIDQCDQPGDAKRKDIGECIPVLKPVPGCRLPDERHHVAGPPQVEILPLPTLQRLLSAQLPNTKLKLLRIPFHATWRQSLADFQ